MTTRSANEIQQSSLAVLHPTYVVPLCWEAQVWFHPSDSLLEDGGVLGGQRKIGRSNWYNRKQSNKWNLKWGCCPWVISEDTEQQVFIVSSLNRWSTITVPTSQNDPKRRHLKSARSSALAPGTTAQLWASKEQSDQQMLKRFTGAFCDVLPHGHVYQPFSCRFLDILNITENSTFSS